MAIKKDLPLHSKAGSPAAERMNRARKKGRIIHTPGGGKYYPTLDKHDTPMKIIAKKGLTPPKKQVWRGHNQAGAKQMKELEKEEGR